MAYNVAYQKPEEKVMSQNENVSILFKTMFTPDKMKLLQCSGPGCHTNVHFMTTCLVGNTKGSSIHTQVCVMFQWFNFSLCGTLSLCLFF